MKYNVLIVDDQLDISIAGTKTRREDYLYFAEKIKEKNTSFEIIIDFAENPFDFKQKIRLGDKNYSAVIADAVLDEVGDWEKDGYTITQVLNEVGSEIPVAIVSSHWEDSNAEAITEAWAKPNCRTFLHWRDFQEGGDGNIEYAMMAFMSMVADKENINLTTTLGKDESIRILHISDIQLGGFNQDDSESDISACVDKIFTHWKNTSPTFIVLTGDVAEHGSPQQYKAAKKWLAYLCKRLNTKNKSKILGRNILYVPGNHDVNLRLAASSRIRVGSDENKKLEMNLDENIQDEGLLDYAYTPFRDFLSEVTDCPLFAKEINDQSFAWVEERFRHLGVVFYGINTAQPASAYTEPERTVNSDALNTIGNKLDSIMSDCTSNPPLVIGLGHHCPVSSSGDQAVKNPKVFSKLFKREVKTALFLHGHTHEEDNLYTANRDFRLVRNCAATLTKKSDARSEDTLRGFSLLELKRENHCVTSLHVASFGWHGTSIIRADDSKDMVYERKKDGMFTLSTS